MPEIKDRKESDFYNKEKSSDAFRCKLGDVCKEAVKCILMTCEFFTSKVEKKGKFEDDKNDNRLDF